MVKKNILGRKLGRDMWKSRMQFVAVILLCALGSWCFSGLDALWRTIDLSANPYFEEGSVADLWVNMSVDREALETLRNLTDVEEVQARFSTQVKADLAHEPVLQLEAYDGVMRINTPRMVSGEALDPSYKEYQKQVQKNAKAMAEAFTKRGYKIVSEGTDNHLMLVDLRTKFPELTGKLAEKCLVAADITTNKNMVPFDSRSPFQTSGLRFGTPAITTRGLKEDKMEEIVALIDRVLSDPENEANIAAVRKEVNAMMANYPLFAW